MTSEVWSAVVRLNLFAALAVLAVLTLRPVVVGLFGARIRYALWSVVPAAALASLWPAAVKTVTIHAPAVLAAAPRALYAQVVVPAAPVATGLAWTDLLALAWLVGVLAGLILVARRQRDFLRQAPRQGPAVVGLIRPRIHLPADFEGRFTPAERRLILTHERTHLARQDARVNGLMALIQCLFWFNPAVHLAAWLSRQDQEMACDETVLARFPGARKTYAEAMLKTLVASAALPLGCYWPSRAKLPLEARIKRLKTRPAGPARRLGGAFVIACLASTAGYAAWAAQPPKINTIIAGESLASAGQSKAQLGAPQTALNRARFAKPQGESQSAGPDSSTAAEIPHVCLTNDCMARSTGRDEAAINDAIRRGAAGDLIRAGGTPAELGAMFRATCDQPSKAKCADLPLAGEEKWAIFTDGTIGLGGLGDATGLPAGQLRFVIMRSPDMAGIPAPADVVAQQKAGNERFNRDTDGAQPITEPQIQPDASSRNVVTGWRHNGGTVTPTPQPVSAPPSRGTQMQPQSLAPVSAPSDPAKNRPKQLASAASNPTGHDVAEQLVGGLLMHVTLDYPDGGRPF